MGFAMPVFLVGYVLIYVFAVKLGWLPVQGYRPIAEGLWPWAESLILPSLALGITYMALIARITRASMLEVLAQDYIRTADSKGLATSRVLLLHALKNASVPIVTVIGIGIALLISGVVITETVFNIPGLGRLTVDAVLKRDYPIVQGLIIVFAGRQGAGQPHHRHLLRLPRSAHQVLSPVTLTATAEDMPRRSPRRWRASLPPSAATPRSSSAPCCSSPSSPWRWPRPGSPAIPFRQAPINRLRPPSERFWFGTDQFGRDVFSRTVYGARVSLIVGFAVAALASLIGLAVGLVCGYFRRIDGIIMRVMDGIMAIPSILLAIALITLTRPGLGIVIAAIVIPEVPRVVRVVRSVVLSIRAQPYVESAIAGGTRNAKLLVRHILPNTLAPLIVQATYVCASAMLIEAGLSFLGAGVPPEIPSWGNIIAQGRTFFQIAPWSIFIPGAFLAATVLAVNMLGDGLRDRLDPRLARRL